MKTCLRCSSEITEQNKIKNRRICRACKNAETKSWKDNNLSRVRQTQRSWSLKNAERLRGKASLLREEKFEMVLSAKTSPCVDCGRQFPAVAMDFDHVRGEKRHSISKLMVDRYSPQALAEELRKCDLVCACCHRLRTAKRASWDPRLYREPQPQSSS